MDDSDRRSIAIYGPIVLIPFLVIFFFLFTLYDSYKELEIDGFNDLVVTDAIKQNDKLTLSIKNNNENKVRVENITINGIKYDFYRELEPMEENWFDTGMEVDLGIKTFIIEIHYTVLDLDMSRKSRGKVQGIV